ncbi:MAG TPA: hypothetical protein VMS73_00950 [Anaerolineaceae bacterium]|nr:hypothetical protein [Anaerolineaceae bacterium]
MSVYDATVFSISGGWDGFDRARGISEYIQGLMKEEGEPDISVVLELEKAIRLIDEAEVICQKVMSEM